MATIAESDWQVAFDDEDHMAGLRCRIADDGDFAENPIAEVYGGTEEEIRRNGELIAAAPVLFRLCQQACMSNVAWAKFQEIQFRVLGSCSPPRDESA